VVVWGCTVRSTYRAQLMYCGGTSEFRFATHSPGEPVDPDAIVGGAYVLDPTSGRITEPAEVGELLFAQLDPLPILAVDSIDATAAWRSGRPHPPQRSRAARQWQKYTRYPRS
jgi:hypothetical protein